MSEQTRAARTFWDMSGYQWLVLGAAWLGWGFDVFDGLLFNYVAPNCVPTLLGLTIGSPEARAATLQWNGILTSVFLIGWAAGGVLFGMVADRIGRTRTLMLTMILYAVGTAAGALVGDIWQLMACRILSSLGIGGEWAAGAAMVAEVVPEKRRVEAGALLYTSAPFGLALATLVNHQISGVLLQGSPETSWRWVFACGLLPAGVALLVRLAVKEPDRWQAAGASKPPAFRELFTPEHVAATRSGLLVAVVTLITWWSCNAFIPVVSAGLAGEVARTAGLEKAATQVLIESSKATATNMFNLGGLIGTLLTIPAAKHLGRRTMYLVYFLASAAAVLATFGLDLSPTTRLYAYFFIGLSVFGVFGSFTYYLPELFPTRLRATGAGFCYNVGRILAAFGPFLVGSVASRGADTLTSALNALFYVGFVPLIGLLALPWVVETRGKALAD